MQKKNIIQNQRKSVLQKSFPFMAVLIFSCLLLSSVSAQQNPSGAPASTLSYGLEDLYVKLDTGVEGSQQVFTAPSTGPSVKTMHTIDEIMAKTPNVSLIGAKPSDVLAGKVFWEVSPTGWGEKSGTLTIPTPNLQAVTDEGSTTTRTIGAAGIDINSSVKIADSTNPPAPTTDRLYNNGGNLYWNGTQLDAAAANINKDQINDSGTLGFDWADSEVADNLTISGGVVNNTAIGGTTPAAGSFTTLKMTTSPGAGKVLTSDASGNASWATSPNVNKDQINNSGTLGFTWSDSEVANNLTISGGSIENTAIGSTTPAAGAFSSIKMATGAGASKVLTSDASGNASWQTPAGGGTDSDTLGISSMFGVDSVNNTATIWAQKVKYAGTVVGFQVFVGTAGSGSTFDLRKNGSTMLTTPTGISIGTVVEGTISTAGFAANDVLSIVVNDTSSTAYPLTCNVLVEYTH